MYMPRTEKKPKKDRKPVAVFFISFAVSFVILMCIFLIFFIVGTSKDREVSSNKEGVPYYSDYQATAQENVSMLIIGCEQLESEPSLLLFASYDAVGGEISIQQLDPSQFVGYKDRVDTLKGHYSYQGITGCVNATEELLGVTVDKFIRITSVGIANMIDYLGGIQYELKEKINCKGISFSVGKQTFDGRRVAAILLDSSYSDIKQELLESYFTEHFNKNLAADFGKYVTAFFYNAETNFNQYDFAIRQKGFLSTLHKSTLGILFN